MKYDIRSAGGCVFSGRIVRRKTGVSDPYGVPGYNIRISKAKRNGWIKYVPLRYTDTIVLGPVEIPVASLGL